MKKTKFKVKIRPEKRGSWIVPRFLAADFKTIWYKLYKLFQFDTGNVYTKVLISRHIFTYNAIL